ncbi:uncharacterized protein LOC106160043 [Lingula anatina]|uniref:Uncharacterized protein LOC106160043 n=1 Tax=Lingula anatina TaxID=7574 RepID=A0A1S3I3R9_LINAN|nr:uncharacterized protein LOC106160043 [Lingula anatina]|eukprot:XP_013392004.1 uncharacterized protein LOC106160043 [Lingula anatina]
MTLLRNEFKKVRTMSTVFIAKAIILLGSIAVSASQNLTASYMCYQEDGSKFFYLRVSNERHDQWSKVYVDGAEQSPGCHANTSFPENQTVDGGSGIQVEHSSSSFLELRINITSQNNCNLTEESNIIVYARKDQQINTERDYVFFISSSDCTYEEYLSEVSVEVQSIPAFAIKGRAVQHDFQPRMQIVPGNITASDVLNSVEWGNISTPGPLHIGTPVCLLIQGSQMGGFQALRVRSCIVQPSNNDSSLQISMLSDYCGTGRGKPSPEKWSEFSGFIGAAASPGEFSAVSPPFQLFSFRGGNTSVYFMCTVTFCQSATNNRCFHMGVTNGSYSQCSFREPHRRQRRSSRFQANDQSMAVGMTVHITSDASETGDTAAVLEQGNVSSQKKFLDIMISLSFVGTALLIAVVILCCMLVFQKKRQTCARKANLVIGAWKEMYLLHRYWRSDDSIPGRHITWAKNT